MSRKLLAQALKGYDWRPGAEAVLQRWSRRLKVPPDEFRGDRDLMLAAVEQCGSALRLAAEELLQDREFILSSMRRNGAALQYASEECRQDREIVLAAATEQGTAVQWACEELRQDQEVMLVAVQHVASALQMAPPKLLWDWSFLLGAVWLNGAVLEWAPEEFRQDRDFLLAAVQGNGAALQYVPQAFRWDRAFLLAAAQLNGGVLKYAAEFRHRGIDREIVCAAVEQDGLLLQWAGKHLRKDRAVCLAAVKQNAAALQFVREPLREDSSFLASAVEAILAHADTESYAWTWASFAAEARHLEPGAQLEVPVPALRAVVGAGADREYAEELISVVLEQLFTGDRTPLVVGNTPLLSAEEEPLGVFVAGPDGAECLYSPDHHRLAALQLYQACRPDELVRAPCVVRARPKRWETPQDTSEPVDWAAALDVLREAWHTLATSSSDDLDARPGSKLRKQPRTDRFIPWEAAETAGSKLYAADSVGAATEARGAIAWDSTASSDALASDAGEPWRRGREETQFPGNENGWFGEHFAPKVAWASDYQDAGWYGQWHSGWRRQVSDWHGA